MTIRKKHIRITVSLLLSFALTAALFGLISVNAEADSIISYDFYGENAHDPGYAQGIITLSSLNGGDYSLYWADDYSVLDGFYPIAELTLEEGGSAAVEFDYHTAIPAGATKILAIKDNSVSSEYSVPESKQLYPSSGSLLYTFNSYSDVHMDVTGYYVKAEIRWKDALEYAVMTNTDFIVSSGDMMTNNRGPEQEWKIYEEILSESGYTNPVWESDGNHDMMSGVQTGLSAFIKNTGTDSTDDKYASFDANIPYYYIREPSTGDLFIFMALENSPSPKTVDEFSDQQLDWVTDLLDTYYGTGINIYLIEHAPIEGFGAGDRMEAPYYKGLLNPEHHSTERLKTIFQQYPEIIHMSGHTHEDFFMGYNYSDENGTACHMIHNPAVVGSTVPSADDSSLDYNNGLGCNSQGYYVEVYENDVIYYGANLTDKLIYPQYCYIMAGSRHIGYTAPDTPDYPTSSTADTPSPTVSISQELEAAKKALDDYYECASYTQYQSLKKLYYSSCCKNYADEQTRLELAKKTEQLIATAEYIGIPILQPLRDTYYFVNSDSWNNVYAFAWKDKESNAIWPGIKMQKVGTKGGSDVFCIRFDDVGQYDRIVFTDGTHRTTEISLEYSKGNCFTLNGAIANSVYYNVVNTNYDTQP